MASSLAKQLAQGASLNASLLVDRSRRRPTQSYLFTAREADQHDLDSIHALGINGFQRLKSIEPAISKCEDALFSDAAKATDRTLLNSEANAKLDAAIGGLFSLLGPYLLEAPTGKVIEWLVRRFRVNKFNVDALLTVFLPYHESPHFKKILSILDIEDQPKFHALLPYKTTSSPLTHTALIDLITKKDNSDLARFVGSLLPAAVAVGPSALHRTLIAFHTGILLDFVKRSSQASGKTGSLEEGTLAWVLPSAVYPLQEWSRVEAKKQPLVVEVVLSSYLLLSALSHTCPLSSEALTAILKAVASCARLVSPTQVLRTLGSICAAQMSVPDTAISKSLVKVILSVSGMDQELKELLKYSGTEKFVRPLVQHLLGRLDDERASGILTSLVTYAEIPRMIILTMTSGLIHLSLQHSHSTDSELDNGTVKARARSLLVHLHQRHPQVLHHAFQDALADDEIDKSSAEQLLLSLSVQLPGTGKAAGVAEEDLLFATMSANASTRATALRNLYERMQSGNLKGLDSESIRSALFARLEDTDVSVVEALYSNSTQLLPIVRADAETYINTVAQILNSSSSSPSRAVVRLHLSFIAAHLYPSTAEIPGYSEVKTLAVERVLFPQLLFSKPRQKSAALVWEIIENSEKEGVAGKSLSHHELLNGCLEAVRWEEGRAAEEHSSGSYEATQTMANVNIALAAKIADNILSSAATESYLKFLLSQIRSTNAHSKALAYLICRALLARLPGQRQLQVAYDILKAMELSSLHDMDDFLRGAEDVQVFLHDLSLATAVVLKPTKRNTLHRLQVSLLTIMASIARPTESSIDWLSDVRSEEHTLTPAEQYISLTRTLYALANSATSLPSISRHIVRVLVGSLGDDVLKFFAGIWLNNNSSSADSTTRYAALRHTAAYLEAHFSTQRFVDFQVILPSLLVALADGDRRIREAAGDCVVVLVRLSQAKKPVSVYAFDAIYGSGSANLQYLDWPDFCKYVSAIHHSRQHLLNDPNYLSILHQQLLEVVKIDSKKEVAYKQRILCYLLSHVSASLLPIIQSTILKSVQGISSHVKFQTLAPAIEVVVSDKGHDVNDELLALLLASVDETAASGLNNPDDSYWSLYTKIIRHLFREGASSAARSTVSHALSSGLFVKLQLDRKVELCKILLELVQQGPESSSACKALLVTLITEAQVINHLLVALQPTVGDVSQRAVKRARVESDGNQPDYSSLIALAEVLGAKPLPGSSELVSTLLDTLAKVINGGSMIPADKTYIEQLLLSAIDNSVTNISVENGNTLRAIRLDTLVELIRVSENPQTFNQALLLIASLAKLVPEAVLQTVMPVFTFMGSNVLHRDDSYSFNVVRKTIDSVLPVMTASLKNSHLDKLDLHIASRAFLRIFTDAHNHIPRHRRISFFARLVEVLGPSEYLSAVCLLLADKMSNRVVRQNSEDMAASFSLPLSLLARFDANVQLGAFVDMLQESVRLLKSDLQLEPGQKTFLEPSLTDDERGSSSHLPRRQAQAIISFVSLGLRNVSPGPSTGSGATAAILSLLLDIAVAKKEALAQASMDQVANIARSAISDVLRVMSARDFVLGALTVVESGQPEIQKAAFDVLAEQIGNVSDKARQELRPTMVRLVDNIKKLLSSAQENLLQAVLNALSALIITMGAGEEHTLTSTIPLVVDAAQQRRATLAALKVLSISIPKLGPRVIPFFKDIVKQCAGVLREEDLQCRTEAINVLHALLTTIPTFWSSGDFLLVIEIYLDQYEAGNQNEISTFIKTLAKRAPAKILLPTVCDLWTRIATNQPESRRVSGYLFVLRRTIQHTDRAVLPDYLRALFKTFVEIFQLCASSKDVGPTAEADAIAAFVEMVVKLNEATFKPLFRKLFDWAFTGADASEGRKLVLLHLYDSLLDYFKSLMTPYMTFLLPPLIDLLNGFKADLADTALWTAVIQTIHKSCSQDEGAFWREDKLRQLIAPVVTQIPVSCSANSSEPRDTLRECLVSLADVMNDPSSLKSLNLDVLMHTRSEDARVRIYALSCSEALWQAHGGKLIGYAPETATFMAECAEDDNDSVVRAAHRLKNAVESIAGRLDV